MRSRRLRFQVERFEHVAVGGDVLLRLAGRWLARGPTRFAEPRLMAQLPGGAIEANPVPDPGRAPPVATPEGESWHAAYSLPLEVTSRAVSFALAAGDELKVALPMPHAAGLAAPAAKEGGDEEQGAHDLLAAQLARERVRRQAAEHDLEDQLSGKQSLREELRRTADELEGAREELARLGARSGEPDGRRGELIARLRRVAAEASAELGTLEPRLQQLARGGPAPHRVHRPSARHHAPAARDAAVRRLAEMDGLENRVEAAVHALAEAAARRERGAVRLRREAEARLARLDGLEERLSTLRAAL